jgi:hypothetical protein
MQLATLATTHATTLTMRATMLAIVFAAVH